MKLSSQILAGVDCSHDCCLSVHATFLPHSCWRTYRLLIDVDRVYLGPASSALQLEDEEREGAELHDDCPLVCGRPEQDILLHL